ncbi:hypothetical protein [Halovenus sp. HT40]|uniref:hypothetical protein n=1 Tax=Halovenus sp. HT40 TaxID=3126691 RepID=UPI00300F0BBE
MTNPPTDSQSYKQSDIQNLSEPDREVIRVIARQTGIRTPHQSTELKSDPTTDSSTELSDNPDETTVDSDQESTVSETTTSHIRKATHLNGSQVKYRIRKLSGEPESGVDRPLVAQRNRGQKETGGSKASAVWLTPAGVDAVEDGLIPDPRTPDWFPEHEDRTTQLSKLAHRIDQHEQALNLVLTELGFISATTLIDSHEQLLAEYTASAVDPDDDPSPLTETQRETVLADPAAARSFVKSAGTDADTITALLTRQQRFALGVNRALADTIDVDVREEYLSATKG